MFECFKLDRSTGLLATDTIGLANNTTNYTTSYTSSYTSSYISSYISKCDLKEFNSLIHMKL